MAAMTLCATQQLTWGLATRSNTLFYVFFHVNNERYEVIGGVIFVVLECLKAQTKHNTRL